MIEYFLIKKKNTNNNSLKDEMMFINGCGLKKIQRISI